MSRRGLARRASINQVEVSEYGGWSDVSGESSTRICMYPYNASTGVSIAKQNGFSPNKNRWSPKQLGPTSLSGHRKAFAYVDCQLFAVVEAARTRVPSLLLPDLTFSKNHCAALHEPADRAAQGPSEDLSDRTRKTAARAQPQPQ